MFFLTTSGNSIIARNNVQHEAWQKLKKRENISDYRLNTYKFEMKLNKKYLRVVSIIPQIHVIQWTP